MSTPRSQNSFFIDDTIPIEVKMPNQSASNSRPNRSGHPEVKQSKPKHPRQAGLFKKKKIVNEPILDLVEVPLNGTSQDNSAANKKNRDRCVCKWPL